MNSQSVPKPGKRGLTRPVLHFRGQAGDRLRFGVTVTGEPELRVAGRAVETRIIGQLAGVTFRTAEFDVAADAGTVDYAVDGHAERFHVAPRRQGGPVRLAYTSCNGGEDEEHARAYPTGRNAMWRDLLATHATDPFALLVMGGDQIYADAVWSEPAFAAWRAMGEARHDAPFTDEMRAQAEAFFLRRYGEVWCEPEVAEALASIPAVMMWDDHDISDGWGSYPDRERLAPVAQGLFGVARRAFALFQLGVEADAPGRPFASPTGAHFGWTADYGDVRLIVPDLRSERTLTRVMNEGHALLDAGLATDRHRLIVSSVPLVNVDLSSVERLLRRIGYDKYTDDLRDQWMSYAHREEWGRVMDRLLDATATGTVSVLSGEIHLAARGTARKGDAVVEQYTASGIAHPPPPRAFGTLLARLARKPWRRGDVELEMHRLGDTGRRYIAERNWLEVAATRRGLVATLHAEETGRVVLDAPASAAVAEAA